MRGGGGEGVLNKTFIYREVGRKGYNLSINLAKVFTQDVLAHSGIYFNCNITNKVKKKKNRY